MSVLQSSNNLEKAPTEVVTLSMNFTNWLATGETLTGTPTIAIEQIGGGTSTVTAASVAISGNYVTFLASGGANGTRHRVTITVATSNSQTLVGNGILKVGNG